MIKKCVVLQKCKVNNKNSEIVNVFNDVQMSADDVYEAYLKKNKVNHNRQDSGYSSKDEDDSRHIWREKMCGNL